MNSAARTRLRAGTLSLLALFTFFSLACATAPAPAPASTAAATGAAVSPDAPSQAAGQASLGTTPWSNVDPRDVRIYAERVTPAFQNESVRIVGNTAIWNGRSVFRIGGGDIRRMLSAFAEADFAAIPAASTTGKRLVHKATLQAGSFSREVTQNYEAPRDPRLTRLVDTIFAIAEPSMRETGSTVTSLQDGLDRIAGGSISPVALSLILNIRPEGGKEGDHFLLNVRDGDARLIRYEKGAVASDERRTPDPDQLRELARWIAVAQPETLSANLWSDRYIEFDLEVLGHTKEVVARSFAQMPPEARAQEQKRMNEMVSRITSIKRNWFEQ